MLASGCVAAGSLILPWFQVSGRPRSTIDVISSATALDVLDGLKKWAVLGIWVTIPLAVAAGLAGWALHRVRASAWSIAVSGIAMTIACIFAAWSVRDPIAWGWWVSVGSGLTATVAAITSRHAAT